MKGGVSSLNKAASSRSSLTRLEMRRRAGLDVKSLRVDSQTAPRKVFSLRQGHDDLIWAKSNVEAGQALLGRDVAAVVGVTWRREGQ